MANKIIDKNLKLNDIFYDINQKNGTSDGYGLGIVVFISEDKDLFSVKFPHLELNYYFDQNFFKCYPELEFDKNNNFRSGFLEKDKKRSWDGSKVSDYFNEDVIKLIKNSGLSNLYGLNDSLVINEKRMEFPGMRESGNIKVTEKYILAEYENCDFRTEALAKKLAEIIKEPFILYDYKGYIITSSKRIVNELLKINKNSDEISIANDILFIDREHYLFYQKDKYFLRSIDLIEKALEKEKARLNKMLKHFKLSSVEDFSTNKKEIEEKSHGIYNDIIESINNIKNIENLLM